MARVRQTRTPLTPDEREGIVLAVNSAFRKLKNLYARIVPIFEDFGFTPPSAGVIARDLSVTRRTRSFARFGFSGMPKIDSSHHG
jgi:hypothetical protein